MDIVEGVGNEKIFFFYSSELLAETPLIKDRLTKDR